MNERKHLDPPRDIYGDLYTSEWIKSSMSLLLVVTLGNLSIC